MSETLAQSAARISAFIAENAPTVDLSPGSVFNELILSLEAQVQNNVYSDVASINAGQSVMAALSSTTDTFNPVIDQIASNYNVVRNQGREATGVIQVTVASSQNLTVPAGTTFVQPNLNFTYSTITSTSVTLSDGSLKTGTGVFYFNVNVEASAVGVDKTVSTGTQFELQTTSVSAIPYFVSATAAGAFQSGQSMETDKQLIARFRAGLSVTNLSSTAAIYSQLQSTFPSFQSIYLADQNDPLNLRASNNPMGLKLPGYVDIYLRNNVALPSQTFTPTDVTYNSGVWTMNIPATMAPGFYRIINIVDAANPNTPLPFFTQYGVTGSPINNVQTAGEARYSVYQTATVTITYANAGPVSFNVTALVPNLLQDVQTLLLNDGTRLPSADYLVKGVVPCEVNVAISVTRSDTNPLDTVSLSADIFNYVNGLGVGEPIAVSKIISICHNYNVAQVNLPIILTGTIRAPYSTGNDPITDFDILLRGTDTLTIPNLPQSGVTPNNTAFFINYFGVDSQENISISVN